MQANEKAPKLSNPFKYTELPCEAPDGLCEILDFGASLAIIDAVAGVNITMSKPGEFKEALIARDPDTIGCVVVLTFTVDGKDVIIKSIAGTLVIPGDLQFNVVESIPETSVPGVLNIAIAIANASATKRSQPPTPASTSTSLAAWLCRPAKRAQPLTCNVE